MPDADFDVSFTSNGKRYRVYVKKRPGVDHFLAEVCQKFELVVFTASVSEVSFLLSVPTIVR